MRVLPFEQARLLILPFGTSSRCVFYHLNKQGCLFYPSEQAHDACSTI
ncbi:MAG: hypothetical protein ACPGWR_15300 [Ardenticatenaceae bacterium]